MKQSEDNILVNKHGGRVIFRILAQAKKHWLLFGGFIVFVFFSSLAEAWGTFLLKEVIDQGIVARNLPLLIHYLKIYGLVALGMAGTVFGFILCAGYLAEKLLYEYRQEMFSHLQKLPFAFYDRTPVGWIMSRLTSDVTRIADLATWMFLDTVWAVMNIAASAYFMFTINAPLALIVMLIIPLLVVIGLKFKQYIIKEYRKARAVNSRITAAFNESITGIRVIKGLVREEKNLAAFNQLTDELYQASFKAGWLSSMFLPVVQIISAIALGVIAWYGGLQHQAGALTVGGIKAFIGYVVFIMWPIQDLARVYAEMQRSVASAERVYALLDTKPEITDSKHCLRPRRLRGEFEFKDVTFYYEKDKPVLSHFSLHVKAGETIALVGPTGGGKSTIVNLACRFYDPCEGEIWLDGKNITRYALHSLHSRLAIVLQTPHLFSGTIRENIRYGRLEATDKEVEAAARKAHAHEFIATLKHGYEEEVGEGGVLLSVGQKQLISISRAILSRPDIIVMDEATSSVDTLTETLIQRGMEELMRHCTSYVIAHRLSTIKNAARILLIDNGRVIEEGTHRQLIRKRGHYYTLYARQFRLELEKDLLGTAE